MRRPLNRTRAPAAPPSSFRDSPRAPGTSRLMARSPNPSGRKPLDSPGFANTHPADGRPAEARTEGACLLFAGCDLFRRHGLCEGPGVHPRDDRRPRQPRQRRPHHDLPRHVQRQAPGSVLLRRQPVRLTGRRGAHRGRRQRREHVRGQRRLESRFPLRVEGAGDRQRLRGGSAHSVQDPALPTGEPQTWA